MIPRGMKAKAAQRFLDRENRRWPDALTTVPREEWPAEFAGAISEFKPPWKVLRSSRFLVLVFEEADNIIRLSVTRTSVQKDGSWLDKITWDELQQLKEEAGYSGNAAVEIYPPWFHTVNVANMRHLWVLPLAEYPAFMWRKDRG